MKQEVMIILLGISCLLLLVLLYFQRRRERKNLERMSRMLHEAISDSFREEHYDESMLSEIEFQMARFLSKNNYLIRQMKLEKEKMKELISDISHQTKTPISNLLLHTELISEIQLSEEASYAVEAIRKYTEKLEFLIQGLIKISRLESGIITVHPVRNPIDELLTAACQEVGLSAEKKGIILQRTETSAKAVFDAKWTKEAVVNLLDNAVKYTPAEGKIGVEVKEFELFCRIDVLDTGIGIAEEEQGKIFTRFYRSQRVAEEAGVGVGLYLAREIAALQGGYIKVSSQVGEGSVFSIYLPR